MEHLAGGLARRQLSYRNVFHVTEQAPSNSNRELPEVELFGYHCHLDADDAQPYSCHDGDW
jgi:hypothetical protein